MQSIKAGRIALLFLLFPILNSFAQKIDEPFKQAISVKFILDDELKNAELKKVVVDNNNIVYVLTNKGLFREYPYNTIKKANFEKAEAQGLQLANIASKTIKNSNDSISNGNIQLQAKTFTLPFENKLFRLAAVIGVLDRGMTGKWQVRTEIAAWKIGPASFLTIPGEIYPEIVNGGIEAPDGQDYKIAPLETPPLRSLMSGKYKFVFGIANDELGYIIPKSEWDNEAPWVYGDKELYGEENSLGPETAPIIHSVAKELLTNLSTN